MTGRPSRSYETRKAETVRGGVRKAEKGPSGIDSGEQTGEGFVVIVGGRGKIIITSRAGKTRRREARRED